MKWVTHFLVVFFALFLVLPVNAQRYHVGVMGGLNFADLDSDIFDFAGEFVGDISRITVYGIGGVVDINLYRNIYLHLEPMYLQRGGVLETNLAPVIPEDVPFDISIPGIDLTFKSSYIEIPVLLKTEFGNNVRPYLLAGPTIGLLLSSSIEAEVFGIGIKCDMKDVTESVNFGFAFGTGLCVPFGTGSLFLEGRYTIGMIDLFKEGTLEIGGGPIEIQETIVEEDKVVKTNGLQIMLGVTMPLSR